MINRIEQMWKVGFVNEQLSIPKVNRLYEKKSIHQVEKIYKSFQKEVFLNVPIIILLFVLNIALDNDNPIVWGSICVLPSIVWFILGLQQLKSIRNLEFGTNCYQYLISIRKEIVSIKKYNKRLAILSVPMILVPLLIYTYVKQRGKTIGEIFGIESFDQPSWIIFFLVPIMTILVYLIIELIFRMRENTNSNIDSLILEMEELNK